MMKTFSGINFNFRLEDINIEDIAHSLSLTCRFNGHCKTFYSVAEHSILVSRKVDNKMWGLLHDAAEAYIGDIITPIKRQLPLVQRWETEILKLVAQKYNLPWPMPQEVKIADLRAYDTEARDLLGMDCKSTTFPEVIVPIENFRLIEEMFLRYFGGYNEKV